MNEHPPALKNKIICFHLDIRRLVASVQTRTWTFSIWLSSRPYPYPNPRGGGSTFFINIFVIIFCNNKTFYFFNLWISRGGGGEQLPPRVRPWSYENSTDRHYCQILLNTALYNISGLGMKTMSHWCVFFLFCSLSIVQYDIRLLYMNAFTLLNLHICKHANTCIWKAFAINKKNPKKNPPPHQNKTKRTKKLPKPKLKQQNNNITNKKTKTTES